MLVMMPHQTDFEIRGVYDGSTCIQLRPKWNLVGVTEPSPVPDLDDFVVWWHRQHFRSLVAGELLQPSNGYWIHAPAPIELAATKPSQEPAC